MKRPQLTVASLAIASICIWLSIKTFWVVPIFKPCTTFVSESAPLTTPAIQRRGDSWRLTISFTPAADEEASSVYRATWLGERTFRVASTGRQFKAYVHDGHLTIHVSSVEESNAVLKDLCFAVNGVQQSLQADAAAQPGSS